MVKLEKALRESKVRATDRGKGRALNVDCCFLTSLVCVLLWIMCRNICFIIYNKSH
jgi:hypothetical protein